MRFPGQSEPEAGAAAGVTRGRRWVVAVAVGAVLLTGAGVGASLVVKSPAQAAADSEAPPPDVLTAPVERRVLKTSVILRGTVVAGQSVDVTPGAAGAGAEGASAPTVTKTPLKAGDRVAAGKTLIEVSGRPVIALHGGLPVYRDLKPGSEGDDVAQLQKALAELGHSTAPDASGTYGAGTKAAVTALYSALGYDPVEAGGEEGSDVEAAEDLVKSMERAVEDARDALDDAEEAQEAQEAAEQAAGASGAQAPGAQTPGAQTPGAQTPGAQTGAPGARAGSGGTAAGAPAGPAASASPGAAPGTGGGQGGGGNGEDVLEEPRKNLARAREDLAEARADLERARSAAGAMLPSSEVVFLESFPARVDSVSAEVGAQVSGAVMKVSSGALEVHGLLQAHQKELIRAGMRTRILSEVTGAEAAARVESVADSPSTEQSAQGDGQGGQDGQASAGSGRSGYLVVVDPDRTLPADLAGQDVRLTVEAGSTDGEVLVVPVTAVSAGADGRTVVTVVDADGRQRRVPVRAGTTGDGYVEVTPSAGARLAEDDRVLTGVRRAAGTATGGGGS
ncbi:peptidoglycan-binding protein [Streptomyces glaucus]|uniref:Peptidoglycan binding-like domain-containing protein n=1 Tax=Streptomyces glaucus TaxID=284029 RepID=A0ABN3JCL6_9ACTN